MMTEWLKLNCLTQLGPWGSLYLVCVRVLLGGRALCVHGDDPNNSFNHWTEAPEEEWGWRGWNWLVNIRPGLSGLGCPVCLNSHLFARVTTKESDG